MDDGYLAADMTRSPSVQWRFFIRALADEVDSLAGPGERDDMLRGIGRRMARMMPLPFVDQLDALEMEMNEALAGMGWGHVQIHLNAEDRALVIRHRGMPMVGSLGMPAGTWLAALLEGLYEGWFAQQPGSQTSLVARRMSSNSTDHITLRFAKG